MPLHTRHENPKFLDLPVTGRNELAETPCAICDAIVPVKRRADGWIEIRCSPVEGCGYTESAINQRSFDSIIGMILNNPKTVFRRASRAEVMEALGMSEPETAPAPAPEPELVEEEPEISPSPQLEPTTQESDLPDDTPEPEPVEGPELASFEDEDEDEDDVEKLLAGE